MSGSVDDRHVVLSGVGLVPGVGAGTAVNLQLAGPAFLRLGIDQDDVADELARLRSAVEASRRQLDRIRTEFERHFGGEHAGIIEAHRLILEDPTFLGAIEDRVRERLFSPERALRETVEKWLEECRAVGDPLFRQRGSDLEEVVDRIIANLLEREPSGRQRLPERMILVAPSINLSTLADFPPARIAGLVATRGGEVSHLTIVARAWRIPFVGGVENLRRKIRTGQRLVVDGGEGRVHVDPSEPFERRLLKRARALERARPPEDGDGQPVMTRDGRRIHFLVNTEVGGDLAESLRVGAEGVGLFRSEHLYMADKSEPVGEERQYRVYRKLARETAGRTAFVRTLDIGDEGHPYFSRLAGEDEPVLGVRGIRLGLRHPEILTPQLRAIVRARREGDLRIVLPMVSSADEMVQARALLRQVEEQLRDEGVAVDGPTPLGAMLEVPAAVLSLNSIAERSDFLLVGTNDLIQYTLAVGRSNQRAADLFNPLHPAVLASLARIAETAAEKQILTVVCGEVAACAVYSELLIGMGFQRLSMGRASIPRLKRFARTLSYAEARAKAKLILRLGTVREVEEFARRELRGASVDSLAPQLAVD